MKDSGIGELGTEKRGYGKEKVFKERRERMI